MSNRKKSRKELALQQRFSDYAQQPPTEKTVLEKRMERAALGMISGGGQRGARITSDTFFDLMKRL